MAQRNYARLRRKIDGTEIARVVLHQGNLKHSSFKILRDCSTIWTREDELAAKHTAFEDFCALCSAPAYRPSLNVAVSEIAELAEAYTAATGKDVCAYKA